MKIDPTCNTNFKAITYRPGSQKYVAEFLTARDKGVLKQAEAAMAKCKKWDLEITSKGLRIASKETADAILVEESRFNRQKGNVFEMEAIYDGHSETCKTGSYCKFDLVLPNNEPIKEEFEKYAKLPLVERSIDWVQRFEKEGVTFRYEKNIIKRVLDFLGVYFD